MMHKGKNFLTDSAFGESGNDEVLPDLLMKCFVTL